jgi:hypothetical protein
MFDIKDIDERADQMSDDERDAYLTAAGWRNFGPGWIPPTGADQEQRLPGGAGIITMDSGLYSRSTAVREQLAREYPDAVPNHLGRYYHGSKPENTTGKRW